MQLAERLFASHAACLRQAPSSAHRLSATLCQAQRRELRTDNPEANGVVPVGRDAVVPKRRTQVRRRAAPAPAQYHTARSA